MASIQSSKEPRVSPSPLSSSTSSIDTPSTSFENSLGPTSDSEQTIPPAPYSSATSCTPSHSRTCSFASSLQVPGVPQGMVHTFRADPVRAYSPPGVAIAPSAPYKPTQRHSVYGVSPIAWTASSGFTGQECQADESRAAHIVDEDVAAEGAGSSTTNGSMSHPGGNGMVEVIFSVTPDGREPGLTDVTGVQPGSTRIAHTYGQMSAPCDPPTGFLWENNQSCGARESDAHLDKGGTTTTGTLPSPSLESKSGSAEPRAPMNAIDVSEMDASKATSARRASARLRQKRKADEVGRARGPTRQSHSSNPEPTTKQTKGFKKQKQRKKYGKQGGIENSDPRCGDNRGTAPEDEREGSPLKETDSASKRARREPLSPAKQNGSGSIPDPEESATVQKRSEHALASGANDQVVVSGLATQSSSEVRVSSAANQERRVHTHAYAHRPLEPTPAISREQTPTYRHNTPRNISEVGRAAATSLPSTLSIAAHHPSLAAYSPRLTPAPRPHSSASQQYSPPPTSPSSGRRPVLLPAVQLHHSAPLPGRNTSSVNTAQVSRLYAVNPRAYRYFTQPGSMYAPIPMGVHPPMRVTTPYGPQPPNLAASSGPVATQNRLDGSAAQMRMSVNAPIPMYRPMHPRAHGGAETHPLIHHAPQVNSSTCSPQPAVLRPVPLSMATQMPGVAQTSMVSSTPIPVALPLAYMPMPAYVRAPVPRSVLMRVPSPSASCPPAGGSYHLESQQMSVSMPGSPAPAAPMCLEIPLPPPTMMAVSNSPADRISEHAIRQGENHSGGVSPLPVPLPYAYPALPVHAGAQPYTSSVGSGPGWSTLFYMMKQGGGMQAPPVRRGRVGIRKVDVQMSSAKDGEGSSSSGDSEAGEEEQEDAHSETFRLHPAFPTAPARLGHTHVGYSRQQIQLGDPVFANPGVPPTRVEGKEVDPERRYQCPLCSRTFSLPNGLAIHLKWHWGATSLEWRRGISRTGKTVQRALEDVEARAKAKDAKMEDINTQEAASASGTARTPVPRQTIPHDAANTVQNSAFDMITPVYPSVPSSSRSIGSATSFVMPIMPLATPRAAFGFGYSPQGSSSGGRYAAPPTAALLPRGEANGEFTASGSGGISNLPNTHPNSRREGALRLSPSSSPEQMRQREPSWSERLFGPVNDEHGSDDEHQRHVYIAHSSSGPAANHDS